MTLAIHGRCSVSLVKMVGIPGTHTSLPTGGVNEATPTSNPFTMNGPPESHKKPPDLFLPLNQICSHLIMFYKFWNCAHLKFFIFVNLALSKTVDREVSFDLSLSPQPATCNCGFFANKRFGHIFFGR